MGNLGVCRRYRYVVENIGQMYNLHLDLTPLPLYMCYLLYKVNLYNVNVQVKANLFWPKKTQFCYIFLFTFDTSLYFLYQIIGILSFSETFN